jgi:hypothetical protein
LLMRRRLRGRYVGPMSCVSLLARPQNVHRRLVAGQG